MKLFISFFFFAFIATHFLMAQEPTVGLLYNDREKAFDGYTMFLGGQRNVYLIDNCGELINKWENTLPAGATAYLLPNGNLLRAVRLGQTTFQGGGIGGAVELLDWNNKVIWQFKYHENNSHHQHHDIEPLPNGNVLILAWEHRTGEEAMAKGRMTNKAIWPTQIVEVKPTGPDDGRIVWSWHLWDRTIQGISDTLPNYGVISEHPERLDINLGSEGGFPGAIGGIDWLHCNSVEYIEEYDWIMISSKHMHEIYIIDHSTTTEEAAGHTGGNYGKGGDFLYRWGNPQNYRRGTSADKKLAGQHDAIWIPSDSTRRPEIMLVNNGKDGRIDVIRPPLTGQGKFAIQAQAPFGPLSLSWSCEAGIKAAIGCSARRLPNGNTIYCDAQTGLIEEVTFDLEKVWQYQNPVNGREPVEQGTPVNTGSFGGGFGSFRAEKYGIDYLTNTDLDLSPKGKVEVNPYPDDCMTLHSMDTIQMPVDTMTMPIDSMNNPVDTMTMPMDSMMNPIDTMVMPMDTTIVDTMMSVDIVFNETFHIYLYPIPANKFVYLETKGKQFNTIELIDINGKAVLKQSFSKAIDVSDLPNGIYILRLFNNHKLIGIQKMVKQGMN